MIGTLIIVEIKKNLNGSNVDTGFFMSYANIDFRHFIDTSPVMMSSCQEKKYPEASATCWICFFGKMMGRSIISKVV
jgi:hypothetical protein